MNMINLSERTRKGSLSLMALVFAFSLNAVSYAQEVKEKKINE